MAENKPKVIVSTSIARNIPDIKAVFEGFDAEFRGSLQRKGFGDVAMEIMIFLSGAFAGGAAWDLFKAAIMKLLEKFPSSQVIVRDSEAIMYAVKDANKVVVIVVPNRAKEFDHIRTLDNLIEHLKSKHE